MKNVQADRALFLGGFPDAALPSKIACGLHPRIEYLEFLHTNPARAMSFQEAQESQSLIVRSVGRLAGPYWSLAMLGRLRRGLSHALVTGEDLGFPMALIQMLTGGSMPISIITHGSFLASRKGTWVLQALRGASQVQFLCLSESLRQQLIQQHHLPEDRVFTVGYGVDTRFFQPDPLTSVKSRQIAAAGMANRDYQTLTAAVDGLNVEAKIAADSSWFRADLDIAGKQLPPNVEARSYGDYVGLRRLYAESACVVVPLYEAVHACGYAVIAEAMAMGKPVITTRIKGQSDYIIEGETGFYVPPGNVQALRARILQLVDDPNLAQRLGQNARSLILEKYTLAAYNGRVAEALDLKVPDTKTMGRKGLRSWVNDVRK